MSSRRPRGGSSNNEDGKPLPEQRASLSAHKPTTASLTSPTGGNNNDGGWGSPSRFGHFAKYTKPKIGPTYQCAVPKYVPPGDKKDATGGETSGNESTGSTSASGSGSARNSSSRGGGRGGRGGRRGGRGGRGGRGRGGRGGGRGGVAAMDQQLEQKLASGEKSAVDMANAAAEHFQDAYGKSINNIPRGGLCVHKPLDRQSSSSMKSDNNTTTTTTKNGLQQLDGSSSIPPSQKLSSLNKQEDYLTYTRNLYLQTPRLHNEMNIDKIWDEETAKKYKVDEVPEAKTSSKKGGKKRKAAAVESNNSIPASSSKSADAPSSMDIDQSKNNEGEEEKELLPLCGLEDDEQALSYLQANYHGDSEKAKLSIMVDSDRGNGVQRRRQLKKKRKEADAEYPDATTFTSESWRWRVHQARPSMLGDYRSSRDPNYHYFDPSPIETDNLLDSSMPWRLRRFGDDNNDLSSSTTAELHSPSRARSYSIAWSEEEIDKAKKIWKSILAYAKHTLAKMEEDDEEEDDEVTDNNNTKPPLNDLLELVGKAHALPTPEETFGRRDLSARQMSEDMNSIIDAIDSGRDYVARLLKSLKDDGEGIELDTLKQSIDEIEHLCPVGLSELTTIKRQVQEATLWEEKLESNVDHGTADSDASDGEDDDNDDDNNVMTEKKLTLEKVERLVSKGRNLTLRPRSLVRLQNRVEKAHILRKKISVWNEARNQENPQNMKFITSLIKEANKVDLAFPELFTLTGVHKKAEEWMDRASVAARTTITFEELESLVTKGEGLPLNVSDVLEKLQKRLTLAKEWMARIDEIVPKSDDFLVWLKRFRHALEDSNKSAHLLSLLSEGSRIPVTMQCSQLLQIEIDARHWSAKAKPWIPENLDTEGEISAPQKRGKVDDVEEYLDRAASIRERLWFDEKEKSEWILDGESELRQMLEMAEEWFDKYDDIISHDNRRKGKLCLPMSKVSTIATEVNRIPLNLGNPATKINKAFTQCDEWMAKYLPLIKRCGIECTYTPTTTGAADESSMQVDEEDDDDSTAPLKLDELSEAVGEADSDLFFDLEVVVKIRKIQETAQTWFDKVDEIAPKEAEAKKKGKHSMNELSFLINQSTTLLVDVADEVERLKLVQNTTMSWRTQAQQNLREIIAGFDNFRKERSASCGRNGAATLTNAVAVSTVPSALESSTIPNPIESVPPPAVHLAVDTIMEVAEDEKQSSDVKEKSHSPAAPPTAHEPWECSKCSTRNLSTKSRCSKCLGWRGGSRVGASKVPAGEPARLKIKARTPSAAPPSANDSVSSAGSMTTRHINSRRGAHGTTGDTATSTTLGSEFQIPVYNGNGGDHLFALVTNFVNSVKTMNILTPEGNTADELNEVVNWFTKAFKLMNNLSDIYDRKSFSKLDKLIKSGQKLVKFKKMTGVRLEDMGLLDDLRQSWAAAVNDDNARLLDLQSRRDKFVEWCERADGAISSTDKKVPIETLKELEFQSASFPQSDIVLRVQKRAKDATEWIAYVADILKKGKKIPLNEAKVLADKGDKLNVSCPEYKTVRAALKATKAWLTKVKKCGAKDGQAEIATSVVNELINEHKTFLVTSEDSLSGLQQVMCGYCVCRQPYEGFMIGCDGCEEWYHGPCVGISQEQGDKLDKYVCVRCSTLRVYKDNATTVAAILRKWTSAKNLSKARAADSQRYGRKVRKAEQDIVKARTNKNSIEQELNAILQAISAEKLQANGGGAAVAAPPPTNGGLIPAGTQNPSVAVPVVSEQSAKLAKSEKALQEKIAKANTTIANCEKRMEGYKTELIGRKNLEAREDVLALSIKKWCAIVKQDIFAPRTLAKAELSRPGADGSLSAPMNKAKLYAESLGIDKLPDIDVILNSFKIFAWTLHSLEVLMRKPRAEEIRLILSHIDNGSVKLGESKCVRMIKSMSSRAQIWQAKANRALAPVSNDRTPYDLSVLKELLSGAKQIPLIMPEEARLWNTIEDRGTRHCICGGPSDGSFMLGCDNCDRWFHGSCMKIDKATGDALSKWICPPCTKGIYVQDTAAANVATETNTVSDDDNKFVNPMEQKYHLDISSHAPDPSELWPPFNLRNDKEAVEVLGKAGESDNEDFTSSSGGSLKAPPQMAPQGPPQIGTDPKLASVTTSLPIARLDSQGSSSSASSYNFAQQPLMAAGASAKSGPRGLSPFCQPVASGASVPVPQGVAGYCQPNISSQPIASAASFVAATVAQSSAFQAIVGSTTQSVQEATTLPSTSLSTSQSHQTTQVSSQAQPSSISLPLPTPLAGGLNNGSNNNMTIQANLSNLSAAVADMDACFNNNVNNNNNDQDNNNNASKTEE